MFITWDAVEKVESFTVQPKFEGNAKDFGMVIPTPARPKLDEMPRDFFKELAVFTILKKRELPQSKLLPQQQPFGFFGGFGGGGAAPTSAAVTTFGAPPRPPAVKVLEGRDDDDTSRRREAS